MSWVRLSGRFTPRVSGRGMVPIPHEAHVRRNDGVIATLLLAAKEWQLDHVSVQIVLSNHFVRYAIVPDDKSISSAEEELAYARFHFARLHGEASRGWEIRMNPGSGGTRLACAVDGALMGALNQSFYEEQQARLTSVQPLLMAVYNQHVSSIPAAGAWLLVVEAERTCVALLAGRTWHTAHNIKGRFDHPSAWVGVIERVRWGVNLDTVPDTILIHNMLGPPTPDQMLEVWKMRGLPTRWPAGLLPERDQACAMALSVL